MVKLVTGIGAPLVGRLVVHDALRATWREIAGQGRPGVRRLRLVADGDRADRLRRVLRDAFGGNGSAHPARATSVADDAVTARELADLLAARDAGSSDFVLVDVREPGEREIVDDPGRGRGAAGGLPQR